MQFEETEMKIGIGPKSTDMRMKGREFHNMSLNIFTIDKLWRCVVIAT
jgi:hypothetical protein